MPFSNALQQIVGLKLFVAMDAPDKVHAHRQINQPKASIAQGQCDNLASK